MRYRANKKKNQYLQMGPLSLKYKIGNTKTKYTKFTIIEHK